MIKLTDFLQKVKNGATISFHETQLVIMENYDYHPTEFNNGLNDDLVTNAPGTNEGSCKIFAFARLNSLTDEQTLILFGDYYRVDVLQNPNGADHQNIRNFMKYGWSGIAFNGVALTPRNSRI
jgi:HopJ type III effector protein